MQNTFEQLNESLERLDIIIGEGVSLSQIEKDILLERLRESYLKVYGIATTEASTTSQQTEAASSNEQDKDEEQRRLAEAEAQRKAEEQRRLAEEEAQRKAEEEAQRKAEEQRRLAEEEAQRKAEEQRRLAEEEAQRKAEEQRRLAEEEAQRKAEEQRRLAEEEAQRKAEEQRRLAEEEAQRKAEEQRRLAEEEAQRKAEEQKNAQSVRDEDDLLQFMPQKNTTKPTQRSLNDLFSDKVQDHSLGAQFQHAKVSDLTKAISINDKFTFIKELFNNRGEEFSAAISTLNQCATMDEAFNCLENYKKKFFWDSTSTAYLSLCDLLRRKFM